jgi:hypothetical protein
MKSTCRARGGGRFACTSQFGAYVTYARRANRRLELPIRFLSALGTLVVVVLTLWHARDIPPVPPIELRYRRFELRG